MLGVKKVIYILLTIFFCLMLLFILNAIVAIPTWVQYVFLVAGTVGGYFLGQYWWKIVYIQRSEGGLIREAELLANVRVRMGYRQDGPPPARTPQESGIGQHGGWGTNSDG